MNTDATSLDHLAPRPRRERLTTTLIFAVLIHGILLLGVGFAALVPEHPPTTTVNVTVATSRANQALRNARYLARFNQFGPGNTRVRVPERPSASVGRFLAENGTLYAKQLMQWMPSPALAKTFAQFDVPQHAPQDRIVTTTSESRLVAGHPHQPANALRAVSLRLPAPRRDLIDALPLNAIQLPQLYGPQPQTDARTTNARQSIYAPYLLAWQRRIERVGTNQFAKLVPRSIKKGHLTLSVTLASDGSVRALSIVKRSSHPELDAAALKIIRLAAPFAPFSPELRAHSKTLTFTYRWNFIRHAGQGALGLGG